MRTIIVEDEPLAMRHLRAILESKCNNVEIIGTAENGAEGLEQIRFLMPDVVVTDVKMPVMDGIELASCIQKEFPAIYVVIVSGYQEFAYAKKAIKYGVMDYLTKPVNIAYVRETFDSIDKKLRTVYFENRFGLLKRMVHGLPVDTELMKKCLPFSQYSVAIVRMNGLPSRFHASDQASAGMDAEREFYSEICSSMLENNIWYFSGRDDREWLFFRALGLTGKEVFRAAVVDFAEGLKASFHTIVFDESDIVFQECKRQAAELYRTLDQNIVLGRSRTINGISENRSVSEKDEYFEAVLNGRMKYLITNGLYEEVGEEIIKLFMKWENEQYTQIKVENNLRQLLYCMESHAVSNRSASCADIGFMLDEAMAYTVSFGDLMASTWEMAKTILQYNKSTASKIDSPDFFQLIIEYLEKNLTEQISLQSLCSVFGISQSYMSRLFRKYKQISYSEYLTLLRIEKAKQLMERNTDLPIKDVAEMVGFSNPFYFSRVFRLITGKAPSDYCRMIEG